MSIANYLENKILDKVCRNTNYTVSAVYIKLHTGNPGEDCTSNAATETTRKAVTFGSAASGGSISNTADIDWTNVAATETYTHVSLWDASTGGNALWYGALDASASVNATDDFSILTGNLTVTLD